MEQHLYQPEIEALLAHLAGQGREPRLRSASDESVQWLRDMAVPESIVAFFAVAEPIGWIEIQGVEIGPVAGLRESNTNAVPGIAAVRYGYVVIAKTVSGDVFCVDTNHREHGGQTPIYIIDHTRVWEGASEAEVDAGKRLVTTSFHDFLQRFLAGDLPYDFDLAR